MDLLEREGPKYQYGRGCLSDGVLGCFLGAVCGLQEDLLDPARVASHLRAVHDYNLRHDLSDHANPQRPSYALNSESGLLLCSWPKGGELSLPFVYSNEVWTGIEYQVASHLIHMGLVDEGLEVVRAARSRYDGRVRNPFNEFECGHWYARALVAPDEERTGEIAAGHLLGLGHCRLLHLTYTRKSLAIRDRARGFRRRVRQEGFHARTLAPFVPAALVERVDRQRITAVFCHNDWLALQAWRAFVDAGMRVPEDVSILGVDNSPTFVSLCPDLTTMDYPREAVAACVTDAVKSGSRPAAVPSLRVVERTTVGPPPA